MSGYGEESNGLLYVNSLRRLTARTYKSIWTEEIECLSVYGEVKETADLHSCIVVVQSLPMYHNMSADII